jgi:hypothetical protein
MNNADQSLDRLLRSAAAHKPAMPPEEAPFGFATRVVAGWKSGAGRERGGLEALWFRRAFLCALAVTAISVGWSFKTDTSSANEELALSSYDASAELP